MTSHHHRPNYPEYKIIDEISGVHLFLTKHSRIKKLIHTDMTIQSTDCMGAAKTYND